MSGRNNKLGNEKVKTVRGAGRQRNQPREILPQLKKIISDLYDRIKKKNCKKCRYLIKLMEYRFRRGKSTIVQVVLLTQNIVDSFEAKKNTGVVLSDRAICHCLAP